MDKEQLATELYNIILKLETVEDCKKFFDDLCTYKEVEQMAQRAHAAKLFKQGKTYTQIMEDIDLSSATLSRVSRCVFHGSGGYEQFIDKE